MKSTHAGRTDPPPEPCLTQPSLRRELDGDDVPVAHRVIAPLETQRAAFARGRIAAGIDQLAPSDHFGADEAPLDVRVDLPGGMPGREPLAQVPGLGRLGLTGGE